MDPERHRLVKEVLAEALDLEGEARGRYLEQVCAGDFDLRREVEELLALDRPGGDGFLERPLVDLEARPAPAAPSDVGPYRILRELGRGGMGTVYLAEQAAPVERRVALKVIGGGPLGAVAHLRFAAERQALARLAHPNVASLYEASSTAEGTPFFAMELVDGPPVTAFCDRERLDVATRLELFVQVCDGVAHAHQKGVLHRDLKPSNVLVTTVDGRAVPKVIDFGIAKALDRPLVAAPTMTGDGLLGTPAYMSPEAIVDPGSVDTRSDVYSLGVLLYELLVGVHPFAAGEDGALELLRRITEDDPVSPTARWRTMDPDARRAAADRRGLAEGALPRVVGGDLEWIVMRAIAREPARRYGSARELADDVRRHLRHEPVEARPPSVAYRTGRFVRRHRVLVVAATVALLALLAGVAGTTAGMVRARRAQVEADRVSQFLERMLEAADPWSGRPGGTTVRELLDEGARQIAHQLHEEPHARIRLLRLLGESYFHLGERDLAAPLLEEARELAERELGADSLMVADVDNVLGLVRSGQGRRDEGRALLERALAIRTARRGPDDPSVARALADLADVVFAQGRAAEAEDLLERALAIREAARPPEPAPLARTLDSLAQVVLVRGRPEQASQLTGRALAVLAVAGQRDGLGYASLLETHAQTLYPQGRLAEARAALEESVAILEPIVGPDSGRLGQRLHNLGILYRTDGELERARACLERALAIHERPPRAGDATVANTVFELGLVELERGDLAAAEALLERSRTLWEASVGPDDALTAWAYWGLGELRGRQGRLAQAEEWHRRALEVRQAAHPDGHPELDDSLAALAAITSFDEAKSP